MFPIRKSIFLFLFFFFLAFTNLWSQQILVDSLIEVLKTESNPIQRIDLYLGIIRAHGFTGNNVEVKDHLQKAAQLSNENNYKKGIATILLFEGTIDYNDGEGSETTLANALKALSIARSISSKSVAAMAYYHLGEYYIYEKNNYSKGIEILLQAISEIDETVPDKHIGNIYKTLAAAYDIQGKDSLTIATFQKALFHFERVETAPFIVPELGRASAMEADRGLMNKGQIHVYLSRIYSNNGQHQKALDEVFKAEKIYNNSQSPSYIAWTKQEAARIYLDLGMHEKAITHFQLAIKTYEEIQLIPDLMQVLGDLGDLFFSVKDYEVAAEYFLKEYEYAIRSKDTVALVEVNQALGNIDLQKKNLDEAIRHFSQAENLTTAIGDSSILAGVYINLGRILFQKKEFQKALAIQKKAVQLSEYFQNDPFVLTSNLALANTHLEISNIDSALIYAHRAQQIANELNSEQSLMATQITLSRIFEKKKDYAQALAYHQSFSSLNEKLYAANAQQKLKEEQVRQNIVEFKKETARAELQADLLASRNRLYLILGLVLIGILLIGIYLFQQLRKVKHQLESQNFQLQQLNATKDKFFGIIAHDIRSPIVALDGVGEQMDYYLKKNKPDKLKRLASRVDATAKKLSGLLDNLLNWALLQQGVIPYHPKALNVNELGKNIFEMFQNNADTKNITLHSLVDKKLKVFADESALNTILRNLISNAIKFTPKGGRVTLSTETKEDKIFININDTGTGISTEKLSKLFSLEKQSEKGTAGEKGTGLGLTLVRELVELNKGLIDVSSVLGKGSNFSLAFPNAA